MKIADYRSDGTNDSVIHTQEPFPMNHFDFCQLILILEVLGKNRNAILVFSIQKLSFRCSNPVLLNTSVIIFAWLTQCAFGRLPII